MTPYHLVYADKRVQKRFIQFINQLPAHQREKIFDALETLKVNPRPRQFKILAQPVFVYGYWAPCRLRIENFRVLYDIDESRKTVVILAIRRRNEKTYL